MKLTEKYIEGMSMDNFKRIDDISKYNNNYYIGFDGALLFAHSDDDDTTEWWLLRGTDKLLVGYSHTSQSDKLIKSDKIWT